METITKTQVPEAQRGDFLPRHVGNAFMRFENSIYDWMGQLCADYNGGYWQFYELSNGGFFMALDSEKRFRAVWPDNYSDEEMSAEAASIAANLFALNALCWQSPSEALTEAYYALRDFAAQHNEGAKIMRVID